MWRATVSDGYVLSFSLCPICILISHNERVWILDFHGNILYCIFKTILQHINSNMNALVLRRSWYWSIVESSHVIGEFGMGEVWLCIMWSQFSLCSWKVQTDYLTWQEKTLSGDWDTLESCGNVLIPFTTRKNILQWTLEYAHLAFYQFSHKVEFINFFKESWQRQKLPPPTEAVMQPGVSVFPFYREKTLIAAFIQAGMCERSNADSSVLSHHLCFCFSDHLSSPPGSYVNVWFSLTGTKYLQSPDPVLS